MLGYWIDERFAGALLVRRRDARGDLATTSGVPARTLSVENNPVWRNLILPALHPGMRIHAEVWASVPRLWFGPIDRGGWLGSSPAHQIRLAFRARGEGRLRHRQVRLG